MSVQRRRLTRPRGLMLFEVMLALSLLGAFALAAMHVVRASIRVSQAAGEASSQTVRFDGAVSQLRHDVWGAARIETPDARTVRVESPDGKSVAWAVDDQGSLTRTPASADDSKQQWLGVAPGVTFEADGAVLLVIEPEPLRGGQRSRMPLMSQVALAKAGRK